MDKKPAPPPAVAPTEACEKLAIVVGMWLLGAMMRKGEGPTRDYFALYSRHRLVSNSPDEEFAMLAEAEGELK